MADNADDDEFGKVIWSKKDGRNMPTHVQRGDKKNELHPRGDGSGWDEYVPDEKDPSVKQMVPYLFKKPHPDDEGDDSKASAKKKSAASKRYKSED